MNESLDAVEILADLWQAKYPLMPTEADVLAALLEAAETNSVRLWWEACPGQGCRNGELSHDHHFAPCPTCKGQGFSYRVAGLEPSGWLFQGYVYGVLPADVVEEMNDEWKPLYRQVPIPEPKETT